MAHRRDATNPHSGRAAERVEFTVKRRGAKVRLEYSLPRARVIDDLNLSLWTRANRNGIRLALRIVFPHQEDPRTRDTLRQFLFGDTYTQSGQWQQLTCSTPEQQLRERLVRLRSQLRMSDINLRDLFVDQVVLEMEAQPGLVELLIDDLEFGPIVAPQTEASSSVESDDPRSGPPVSFELGRLSVQGRPFFPRITPYHGEEVDVLAQSGLNLVWTPDSQDQTLLDQLRDHGMWAIATPPRVTSPTGQILDAQTASLVPFTDRTNAIVAWYFGTLIPPEARDDLTSWVQQTRSADRRYRRPLMADVSGLEHVYSRHLAMTGMSRHVINTAFSLKQYRDWLNQKHKLAQNGCFAWTWIQTEPASINTNWRRAAGKTAIVIEPEQIRLQVYAALSSECRGIGFWKSTSLAGDAPDVLERQLALTQLNLELKLLEPFLATGTLIDSVPFQVPGRRSRLGKSAGAYQTTATGGDRRSWLTGLTSRRPTRPAEDDTFEAVLLRSDHGLLLLPVWYQRDTQFVPGQMVARDVTIVVPQVPDTAHAFEVTTTRIRSLETQRVTGGMRITLPRFDQTAAVVFTSDTNLKSILEDEMRTMRATSARVSIELAKAKLTRVTAVDAELRSLGVGQPDAPQWIAQAQARVQDAQTALQLSKFNVAREACQEAMQRVRILQRVHWENAAQRFSSPVSSPHTVCFQTLPDHWRMVAGIGQSAMSLDDNLLPADFEDRDAWIAAKWRHEQEEIRDVRAAAEFYPDPHKGNYCLRLIAVPATGEDVPSVVAGTPVSVSTPPLPVRAGQILHVSGWVRVAAPMTAGLDGAMIYDSFTGKVGALRWHNKQGWNRFEMIREAHQDGEFFLTMALGCLGEIHFDDLRVVAHTPRNILDLAEQPDDLRGDGKSRPGALDFWQRFNRLRPSRLKEPEN